MKTDTRIKLKAALGIGVTYILFFAISIALYMECVFPFLKENGHKVWGAITSWWTVWKEKTGNG